MLLHHNSLHSFIFLTYQSACNTMSRAQRILRLWLSLVFLRSRKKVITIFRSQAWPHNWKKAHCTAVLNIRLFLSYSMTGIPPTAYVTYYTVHSTDIQGVVGMKAAARTPGLNIIPQLNSNTILFKIYIMRRNSYQTFCFHTAEEMYWIWLVIK